MDTGVVVANVVGAGLVLLVPVKDTADEGGNESDAGLCASDSLAETEEEREIAVNAVVALELAGSLDTLPGRGDLDQDAVLGNANRLVERDELLGLGMVPSLSKDRRASTSVETRPGMIFKISFPNSTS